MATVINNYLKDKTEEIVFVELQPGKTLEVNGVVLTEEVPLPILVKEMSKQVTQGEDTNFSITAFIEGMIRIIGIDSVFKHRDAYIGFLNAYSDQLYKGVLSKGFESVNRDMMKEALIYFRAAYFLAPTHVDALYNYARCLEDMAVNDEKIYTAFSEEAFRLFNEMKILYPDHYLSYFHLGFHYSNASDHIQAKELWTKALKLNITDDIKKELVKQLKDNDAKMHFKRGYEFIVEGHC